MGSFNPKWVGCRLNGDTIVTDNNQTYTLQELRFIRWELNNWRRIAETGKRDLEKFANTQAVIFQSEDIQRLRDVLKLLDEKLPGYSVYQQIVDQLSSLRRRR